MQAGAPARDNSRSTGAAPLAFVKSPNSAAGKSAAHRRPRERSCISLRDAGHRYFAFETLIDCSCSVGVRSGPHIMRACGRFDSLTIIEIRCRTAVLKGRKGFRFSPSEAGPDAELLYLRFNQPLGRLHKALLHFTNADSQALLKPWCFCRQPASCGPILIRDKLSPSNPSARIRTRLPARLA